MENKELKNEKEVKKPITASQNEDEGICLDKELNPETLVIQNEKMKELINKSFQAMTKEEKAMLPLARLKVIKRKNTFTRTTTYVARLILSEGVYLDKELKTEEYFLLKNYRPELFTNVQTKQLPSILVPIKLWADKMPDGAYRFRYNAELCAGVFGRYRRGGKYINYLNERQIQLLLIDDTKLRFVESNINTSFEDYDELEDE